MSAANLKEEVAGRILWAITTSSRPTPKGWILELKKNSSEISLIPDAEVSHWDRAEGRDYKRFNEIELPEGYSDSDYEEALTELFPRDVSTYLASELGEHSVSKRKISRKHLEDSLAPYDAKQ